MNKKQSTKKTALGKLRIFWKIILSSDSSEPVMNSKAHKAICALALVYLIATSAYMLWHKWWFSPDQFFGVALVITLFLGRLRQFLQDWFVPTVLLLSYEYLRGIVPILTLKAHVMPMIYFDKFIFGGLPTITLQHMLFSDGTVHWYDYIASIIYMAHFILPMITGFIFWLYKKQKFQEYYYALILLSYMAFITYIIFPAVPPWMASDAGFIPKLFAINSKVFDTLGTSIDLPTVYKFFGANLVAAVPSLHAAYPWLTFLFITRYFKHAGLFVLPYVLAVWFAIVYLGEHYVFDIVIGVLYATVAYGVIVKRRMLVNKAKIVLLLFKQKFTLGVERG